MGLNQKLYDIMCETESLEKDLVVGTGNSAYKAIGEKAVLNMLKPLFKRHKIICVPKDGEIKEITETYIDGYGKNKFRGITQLKTYFTLIDIESGEERDIVGFGNGADSQDKGSGKAFTYAMKTALSKSFMLFSGEDTDNTHSDDIGGSSDNNTTVTTKMLQDVIKEKGYTEEQVLQGYNKETGKNATELKFISQDKKQEYYKKMNK